MAKLPFLIQDPCLLGINPHIQMLRLDIPDRFRTVFGISDLLFDEIHFDRDAEVRIRLDPIGRIIPIIIVVHGEDSHEERIILRDSVQDVHGVLSEFVAWIVAIESGCRDDEHQRLSPGAHARNHDIEHGVIRVGMVFIDDYAAGRITIVDAGIR